MQPSLGNAFIVKAWSNNFFIKKKMIINKRTKALRIDFWYGGDFIATGP